MKLDREKYLLPDEAKRLLAAARGRFTQKGKRHAHASRDYALLALGFNTGFRAIELTGIRVGDLRGVIGQTRNERPAKVRVQRAKKRGPIVEDEIALPEVARQALAEYLGPLPIEAKELGARIFPLTVRQIQRLFKTYLRLAGLSEIYSPHSMRHTRGIMLYTQHKDLKLVQDALGHSSLKSTEVYMHSVDKDKKLSELEVTPEEFTQEGGEDVVPGKA